MALLRRVVMRLVLKLRSAGSRPWTHAEVGGARMDCGWIIGLVSLSAMGLQVSSTPCGTAEHLIDCAGSEACVCTHRASFVTFFSACRRALYSECIIRCKPLAFRGA